MSVTKNTPGVIIVPRGQTEPPRQWKVVLHSDSLIRPCGYCVLREVFNLGLLTARQHVMEAQEKGRSIVFSSSREVAEQKRDDAEECRKGKMERVAECHTRLGSFRFTAEPC